MRIRLRVGTREIVVLPVLRHVYSAMAKMLGLHMDHARRAELAEKQQAARERAARRKHEADYAAYVLSVPVLAALEAAGESFATHDYGALHGPLNLWAHAPERSTLHTDDYCAFPPDTQGQEHAILQAVAALHGAVAPLQVILPWEALVVEIAPTVLARHLALIRKSAGNREFAITSPGASWLVEVSSSGVATGHFPSC